MSSINYADRLFDYKRYLYEEEHSQNTIQKYIRDVKKFLYYLGEKELCKIEVMKFKEKAIRDYAPSSVNSIIVAVNGFLTWLGLSHLKVKPLKVQKEIFAEPEKELTQTEYKRLIMVAEEKENKKLSLLIQTICSTGIRVSELKYVDVSSLRTRRATVSCKGKTRTIFLPKALCEALQKYCQEKKIVKGSVFVTRSGASLDRSNIWKMMKALCEEANVDASKVFPHNLRHLFARTYYEIEKDIGKLADILGHSSINTTRIYTMETGDKHARQIDRMSLAFPLKKCTT